jgi:dUTP pyrophosphatase
MRFHFEPEPKVDDGYLAGPVVGEGPTLLAQRLNDWGYEPTKGYPSDAGFDLIVAQDTSIFADDFALVPCSIAIASDEHHWFLILGRSSALWKRGLFVPPAVIDNGFRGEIFVGVKNWNPGVVMVKRGERIAQLIPMPTIPMDIRQVEVLPPSDRGDKGFGSTGV